MKNYEITLWWSEDDRLFVAEIPELPGCIAHGSTREDALAAVGEAMELWIASAVTAGEAVPQPRRREVRA